jgi:hypothetical protein
MGITKLLMVIGAHSWMRALACLAVVGSSSLAATAKDEAAAVAPTLACEIRYHFRERLEGVKAGGKKFSAPAYEREALPQSTVAANGTQARLVQGRVAHLPYRFVIKLSRSRETAAEMLEVSILGSTGKPLSGYPQTMENPFAKVAGVSNKQFKIPVPKGLAKTIEKTLLARNQFLTQVDLSIDYSP